MINYFNYMYLLSSTSIVTVLFL